MAARNAASTMPVVSGVTGTMSTTTSACGSSAGSSVEGVHAVARGAGDPGELGVEAGEHPADRAADVAGADHEHPRPDQRVLGAGAQRPASCARVKCGMPRWAASIAVTAHSAVDGVCAPRALHSVTRSGSRPTNFSAPALISCTSCRCGSASSTVRRDVAAAARHQHLRRGRLAGGRPVGGSRSGARGPAGRSPRPPRRRRPGGDEDVQGLLRAQLQDGGSGVGVGHGSRP